MEELSIVFQPQAPRSLYAPRLSRIGEHDGELEAIDNEQPSAMTFRELISAIFQLIKQYLKGRKHER